MVDGGDDAGIELGEHRRGVVEHERSVAGVMRAANLVGLSFGRLTVIVRDHSAGSTPRRPRGGCRCSCGSEPVVFAAALLAGRTRSRVRDGRRGKIEVERKSRLFGQSIVSWQIPRTLRVPTDIAHVTAGCHTAG